MNRQQLTYLLILGVVFGGLALFMVRRDAASYQTTTHLLGQRVLPEFPMNDVTQIHIRDATNELNLVRVDERWRVRERHNYPADFAAVSGLLQKFWDMKIVQAEEVGPSQLPRLRLAEPDAATGAGTLLRFQGTGGDDIATVLIGRPHMRQGSDPSPMGGENWPDGRYLRVVNGGGQVVVVSDALSEVEPRADRFLNKDFFRVEKVKSLEVTPPESSAWRLVRDTDGGAWRLAEAEEGETLDTAKVTFANNVLAFPSFVDVMDPERPVEETGMDEPWVAEIETFDGLRYTVRIGKPNLDEQYPLAVAVRGDFPRTREADEDESDEDRERLDREFQERVTRLNEKLDKEQRYGDWTYLVSKWTVDSLLKSRADLLASAEPAAGSVSGFDADDFDDDFDFEGLDLENLGIFPNP
jgi:hypothetical protein